jgi:hypothetical protein
MIAVMIFAATPAAPALERGESWRMAWNDEFNGRAIGLPESRDLKTVDAAAFPARLEIDYVRVWASEHSVAGR